MALDATQREELIALIDHEMRRLRATARRDLPAIEALEAARVRLLGDTGDSCVDCGDVIALTHLRAKPASRRCRHCEQRYDSIHALSAAAQL